MCKDTYDNKATVRDLVKIFAITFGITTVCGTLYNLGVRSGISQSACLVRGAVGPEEFAKIVAKIGETV